MIEEQFWAAAKEYNEKCQGLDDTIDMPQRVKNKTSILERHGLDVAFDRRILSILSVGIKQGGKDFDSAVELGIASYLNYRSRVDEKR